CRLDQRRQQFLALRTREGKIERDDGKRYLAPPPGGMRWTRARLACDGIVDHVDPRQDAVNDRPEDRMVLAPRDGEGERGAEAGPGLRDTDRSTGLARRWGGAVEHGSGVSHQSS